MQGKTSVFGPQDSQGKSNFSKTLSRDSTSHGAGGVCARSLGPPAKKRCVQAYHGVLLQIDNKHARFHRDPLLFGFLPLWPTKVGDPIYNLKRLKFVLEGSAMAHS